MNLSDYFEKNEGTGILATCDPDHNVDQAVYSKPFIVDETTIAFVMKERLSHRNLQSHLMASYLFLEKGPGYKGIRLLLTMQRQDKNRTLIESLCKKQPCICPEEDDSDKFLVFFKVNRVRPLEGDTFPA
ncbi:MAG: pyridoxamine 5'-phosphate oxidase family protein [Planctomycetota bacterium]